MKERTKKAKGVGGKYLQAKHSLHGDEQGWHIKGFKENFSCSFTVLAWVQGSLRQEYGVLVVGDTKDLAG